MPAALIAAASAPTPGAAPSSSPDRSRSFSSASWAAAITAAPTPIVDDDPNVGPASGRIVSPIAQLTIPGSSPSTPADELREDRERAGADVLKARLDHRGAVGVEAYVGVRRVAEAAHRAVGHPLPHQPVAVALGLARPPAPAERAGAVLVALAQLLGRPRLPGHRVAVGVVGEP